MNKAPLEHELSFMHDFYGEQINEDYNAFGKYEVTVLFEDRINEITVRNRKTGETEQVDFELPYQHNNIYSVSEREIKERWGS